MSTSRSLATIDTIAVYYHGDDSCRLVGRLSMDGRRPTFGYDAAWLADGLPLSPLEMPLSNGQKLYYGEHASTHYVCGLLADSLPDGWGLLLMDRFFRREFSVSSRKISVLDRFAYIGDNAMGALTFVPEHALDGDSNALDLLTLARANEQVLAGQDVAILRQLLWLGGSPQGARPKAMLHFDEQAQTISSQAATNTTPWLVKFPAQNEDKTVCLIEAIYADCAKRVGIDMPTHRYFDIDAQHAAFGVQRFDREDGKRKHIHTLAGLLNTDFRIPSLDYTQWLRCVRVLTRSQKQVEKAFRQAVFNVVFNNKDDHSKNFSFIMNNSGRWSLSPAYDITYNSGTNGYHQMDICGEAHQPTHSDLMQLAKMGDIKPQKAQAIIDTTIAVAQSLRELLQAVDGELAERILLDVGDNIERMTSA